MQDAPANTHGTLQAYFRDLAGVMGAEPLTREREAELAARIGEGDMEARDELVRANLGFVVSLARDYEHRGLSLPDLIGSGNIGLLRAAESFDGARGFKFISYAVWWIRQAIRLALSQHPRVVRLPLSQLDLLRHISWLSNRIQHEMSQDRVIEEVSKQLNVPVQKILAAMHRAQPVRSLDEPLREREDRSLLQLLPDPTQEPPDEEAIRASDRQLLKRGLACLDETEQYVIQRYFALDGASRSAWMRSATDLDSHASGFARSGSGPWTGSGIRPFLPPCMKSPRTM